MRRTTKRVSADDRRRQILQVALVLFARQGFNGTTTRQIAERARVNEAIIFRHFPKKEDLYWAVINDHCRGGQGKRTLPEVLESSGDDRAVFAALAERILHRSAEDRNLTRLLLFSALENHRLSHRFFRTHVAINYDALADHIRRRIKAGRFRRVDPLLAARGFLGMVSNHILIQELFGGERYQKFDPKKVSAVLADVWLQGIGTGKSGAIKKSSTRRPIPIKISGSRGKDRR